MLLITGANGFIGRHASRAAAGPFRALLHRPDPTFGERHPDADVVVGDLLDRRTLERALDGVHAVLHLAARNVDHEGEGYERVNVEGLRQLLAAAEAAGVHRLLYVSSTGVLGHRVHAGTDEGAPLAPDTPFSRSKAAAESLLQAAHREGRHDVTILRHRFVYGEGDRAVLPRMHRSLTRSPVWIAGGRARLSFVWAGDLADAAHRLLAEPEQRRDDPVYHATDGQPVALAALGRALVERFGGRLPRMSVPFALLHGALRARESLLGIDPETAAGLTSLRVALVGQDNWFSDARLRARLPDFAPLALSAGLERCAGWYAAELERP